VIIIIISLFITIIMNDYEHDNVVDDDNDYVDMYTNFIGYSICW